MNQEFTTISQDFENGNTKQSPSNTCNSSEEGVMEENDKIFELAPLKKLKIKMMS